MDGSREPNPRSVLPTPNCDGSAKQLDHQISILPESKGFANNLLDVDSQVHDVEDLDRKKQQYLQGDELQLLQGCVESQGLTGGSPGLQVIPKKRKTSGSGRIPMAKEFRPNTPSQNKIHSSNEGKLGNSVGRAGVYKMEVDPRRTLPLLRRRLEREPW